MQSLRPLLSRLLTSGVTGSAPPVPWLLRACSSSTQQPAASAAAAPTQHKSKNAAQQGEGTGEDGEDDDDDESFPSTADTSQQQQQHVDSPGFLFISGYAAASALLAIGVAGVGMVGMFWLGNFLNQVLRALRGGSEGGGSAKQQQQPQAAKRLSSAELADMLRQRRAELQAELQELRRHRPAAPEAKTRALELGSELQQLSAAAVGGGPGRSGGWWPF